MADPDSSPETREGQPARRPVKSEAAFRTISEVSEDLDVPQHVLRFWESKFPQIKPLKRGGGRRYYRPEDVQLLSHIRDLLYRDGYTIRGVQKLLREPAVKGKPEEAEEIAGRPAAQAPADAAAGQKAALREMAGELRELKRILAEARRK
jgi:DNA-binding transcriptional MerR regulator